MSILNEIELSKINFKSLGHNVRISTKASIYGANNISIGNNVRIDDFSIISAGIEGVFIGNFVHIAAYSSLIGSGKITLDDYCNISSRVSIYSSSDDYSGESMTNPMIPSEFKNVDNRPVNLRKHVIIGSGSVVLPGSTLKEGAAIGALSLVNGVYEEWGVYAGTPTKKIKRRSKNCLNKEKKFRELAQPSKV